MMLLAIVLVLVGLRWLDITPRARNATQAYVAQLRLWIRDERFWRSPAGPWLALLLPVLVIALIDWRLPWFLHLVLCVVVLWLTLGPRELATDLRTWLSARARGDEADAESRAQALWGTRPRELGELFVESHERLFGVLIWFFALGPAGGVLYRVGRRLAQHWPDDATHARRLHAALAFVPARITAALFAAAGSADDVIAEWRRRRGQVLGWVERTWQWLSEIAAATLEFEEAPGGTPRTPTLEDGAREFQHLEFRALLILLALFAVFTVGSWFG
jgi:membrane protein required for beta-lactamase induction